MEHDPQPFGSLAFRRQAERGAGLPDPLFGPADPLGHRRFGNEKRAGDLGGGEPGDRSQGQGELRRRRQRGVAAQEQQSQRVVAGDRWFGAACRSQRSLGLLAPPTGLVAAQLVDQPPRRHGHQPRLRARRPALRRPLHGGRDESVLHRVFARVEVAVAADEAGEDLRRQPADQLQVGRVDTHMSTFASCSSGFTSTPTLPAAGFRAAISRARSRFSQSTIVKLARYSLASA